MLPFENDLERSRAAVTDAKARAAQLQIDLEKTDFDFEVTVTVDATVDPPKITKTKTDPVKMHTPEEKIKLMEDFVNGSDDVLDDCNAPNAKSNWQKMKIHGARIPGASSKPMSSPRSFGRVWSISIWIILQKARAMSWAVGELS